MVQLLMWAVIVACTRSSQPARPAESPEPATLRWEEQLTGGADTNAELPLVITLHGRGSTPQGFRRFFERLDVPVRIVHLEAPVLEHDGRAWFTFRGKTRETLQAEVDDLADQAVRVTQELQKTKPTKGEPVVVGFSQGSIVVYAIVLRHPDAFAKAIPVAGGLMSQMPPSSASEERPEVIAMHGERDPVMNPGMSARAAEQLKALGFPAEARFFPDNVHWIDGDLERALHDELRPLAE
ncbi:MAG: alpha/beta fold hydrolase [Myxococcota bacterium]